MSSSSNKAQQRWRRAIKQVSLINYLTKKSDRTYTEYGIGSYLWLPDDAQLYVPARVVESFSFNVGKGGDSEIGKVVRLTVCSDASGNLSFTEDGKPVSMTATNAQKIHRLDPESLKALDDMINLAELSERTILHNLRQRFFADNIYTGVDKILVALNPFDADIGKSVCSSEQRESYSMAATNKLNEMMPHIYKLTAQGFATVAEKRNDTSVVISGESGAGKTVTTKHVLEFLTSLPHGREGDNTGETLKTQIMAANPLMEAFGNATTQHNDNSSRFGKFIKINFDTTSGNKNSTPIVSGSISSYLLEKSRVVRQGVGERNYHIFYQLFLLEQEKRSLLGIPDPTPEVIRSFQYLAGEKPKKSIGGWLTGKNKESTIDQEKLVQLGEEDKDRLRQTREAVEALNVSQQDFDDLLRVTAAVLHLGNLKFKSLDGDSEKSQVENKDSLELAAKLLSVKATDLENALCNTEFTMAPGEVGMKPLTANLAKTGTDSFAMYLYNHIFDWVIRTINASFENSESSTSTAKTSENFMGVLDIFGFEVMNTNLFEQLCINYCNEKLQNMFNTHMFESELEIYNSEGVQIQDLNFQNNSECLELIEGPLPKPRSQGAPATINLNRKPTLIGLIGDFVTTNNNQGKDDAYHSKICKECVYSSYFTAGNNGEFVVKHYAGDVTYNVAGMIAKNKTRMPILLENLAVETKDSFLQQVFQGPILLRQEDQPTSHMRNKVKTIGMQFKSQLKQLMDVLDATTPHFVRCIKPSDTKLKHQFDSVKVDRQLRYAGVLEVIKIRQCGYPIRLSHREFCSRYYLLQPSGPIANYFGGVVENELAAMSTEQLSSRCTEMVSIMSTKDSNTAELLYEGEYVLGKTMMLLKQHQYDDLEMALGVVKSDLVVAVLDEAMETGSVEQIEAALQKVQNGGALNISSERAIKSAQKLVKTLRQQEEAKELLQSALQKCESRQGGTSSCLKGLTDAMDAATASGLESTQTDYSSAVTAHQLLSAVVKLEAAESALDLAIVNDAVEGAKEVDMNSNPSDLKLLERVQDKQVVLTWYVETKDVFDSSVDTDKMDATVSGILSNKKWNESSNSGDLLQRCPTSEQIKLVTVAITKVMGREFGLGDEQQLPLDNVIQLGRVVGLDESNETFKSALKKKAGLVTKRDQEAQKAKDLVEKQAKELEEQKAKEVAEQQALQRAALEAKELSDKAAKELEVQKTNEANDTKPEEKPVSSETVIKNSTLQRLVSERVIEQDNVFASLLEGSNATANEFTNTVSAYVSDQSRKEQEAESEIERLKKEKQDMRSLVNPEPSTGEEFSLEDMISRSAPLSETHAGWFSLSALS